MPSQEIAQPIDREGHTYGAPLAFTFGITGNNIPKTKDLFSGYELESENDYTKSEYAKLVLEAEKIFKEKRKLAHARWWQEDLLVNNRLTWLLTSQSFLFAGYGFLARGGQSK